MAVRIFTPTGSTLSGLALSSAKPKALVLFLHGYGANGADLMSIGQQLAPHLPDVGFVAPDAPKELRFGFNARAWFDMDQQLTISDLDRGVQEARPIVSDYIKSVLETFGLPAKQLLICGFSQGCMMALEVAPRLKSTVGQVIGLSGLLAGPQRLDAETISKPPIFLGHGTADYVVPYAAQATAKTALTEAKFNVESEAYQGVGHGIPPEAVQTLFEKVSNLTV